MKGAHSHLKAYTALLLVLIIALGFIYGLYAFFGVPTPATPVPVSYQSSAQY